MGYSYNYTRTYADGLEKFMAIAEFRNQFAADPTIYISSNSSYYNIDNLLKKIDKYFNKLSKNVNKKIVYKYYDYNTSKIVSEVFYTNITDGYCLALITKGIDNVFENYVLEEDNDEWEEIVNSELQKIKDDEIAVVFEGLALHETAQNNMQLFFDEFLQVGKNIRKIKRELNIISRNEYGLYLQSFPTNKIKVNIETNYNDEFKDISKKIIKDLNTQNKSGIVLLNGLPGTGKSTYLRFLTQKITDKKLIYMPPDMSVALIDPDFISFMLKNKNSILIIEDAENILKKRTSEGNQAISNLLNLSDGLLGDALSIQIICTFNYKNNDIDDALLRPGRLIAEYNFDKLKIDKANKLLNLLYQDDSKTNVELTLAEIYNFKNKHIKTDITQNPIGFRK